MEAAAACCGHPDLAEALEEEVVRPSWSFVVVESEPWEEALECIGDPLLCKFAYGKKVAERA